MQQSYFEWQNLKYKFSFVSINIDEWQDLKKKLFEMLDNQRHIYNKERNKEDISRCRRNPRIRNSFAGTIYNSRPITHVAV